MKPALLALSLCLCVSLVPAAHAGSKNESVRQEISRELTEAREEVRVELAQARRELQTGNLELNGNLHFGKHGKKADRDETLPKGEISPRGDLLIDGKQVAIDDGQRRELLAYRKDVIGIAMEGIDIGESTALATIDAVDRGLFGLMFSALSGGLERRVEKLVKDTVEPAVLRICQRLPDLLVSQQRLSARVPEFRPYARLEHDDVSNCENDVRSGFAMR